MLKIEKVKLTTGLQTDVSPKAIDTQGNRLVVNPIIEAVNARYVSSDDGTDLIFQSVKGTTKVTNASLPAGTNVVIGAIEDVQNNALIYFNYNSNNNHCVFKYTPEDGVITKLIQSSYLNFQNNPRYLITGAGIQGNMLYWSDGYNPQRAINMTRDYSAITSDKPITLIKEHPLTRPDVLGSVTVVSGHPIFRGSDTSIKFNKIADKNLQFSYQYVFIDNEKSVIAPFSKLAYASPKPVAGIDQAVNNVVQYRHTIPSDIRPFVKQVLLLVREGNTGNWSIWKRINPTSTAVSDQYTGYEPLEGLSDTDAAKIQEAIPTTSKALTVHKNRVVLSADEEGFDVTLSSGAFPITLTITETFENYTTGPSNNTYFKFGGARTFGIALFDERGRSMGVFGRKKINFSHPTNQNNVLDDFEIGVSRPYVQLNLSGTLAATPKAKYFSIVCTDEEYYENYMQVPVIAYPYRYEKGTAGLSSGEVEVDGRVYFLSPANDTEFNKIHLLLPKEAAFIPTEEYFVRLRSQLGNAPYSSAKMEKVIAVEGSQFVVVNNLGITDWTGTRMLFVEIFKPKAAPSDVFYEITDRIALSSGVPSQTSFTIYGDQYYVTSAFQEFTFRQDAGGTIINPDFLKRRANIESPTPTYGFNSVWKVPSEAKSTNLLSSERLILDYSKKAWNRGKTFVELTNPVQLDRSTVVRYSNPAIQDSFINGMSSFDSGDEKVLPVDRTPIVKFVPVGNNILAVHERSLTTLYVEQSMIKNAEGVEQLITTDKFIGYDREVQGKIGSYHPESVAAHLGLAFGFDVFKGVVWQYSNEGVSIVSRFGKEKDFHDLAEAIRPYKDTAKIIGGIDPDHKEYMISFVFPSAQSAQNITYGYNWERNFWTVQYSDVAEMYANINRSLVSFKAGELWVHNTNPLYNNFYGVQYQRRIKVAVNPFPTRSKNYMALQIATNLLSSGSDAEMLVVRCYTEDGQETYMKVDDFEKLEGVFYGPILKDINTLPALIPSGKIALRNGDDMLGRYLEVELINDHTTDPCPVQFLNVTYTDSEYTH